MVQFTSPIKATLSLDKSQKFVRTIALGFGMMVFSLLAAFSAGAQDLPSISIAPGGVIRLPEGQAPQATYLLDLGTLQFSSDADMVSFFSTKSGQNYLVRAVPHLNKAILHLQLDKNPTWSTEEWNAHLAAESAIRPIK